MIRAALSWPLRRWLLSGAALCLAAGVATLTLALLCFIGAQVVPGGPCELWLLGPLTVLPLGAGLGLIGLAAGRSPAPHTVDQLRAPSCDQGCEQREET